MKASVIIPSFNGAHKIHLLLDSLTKQIDEDFEVIVVIDGSTDHTIEILKRYRKSLKQLTVIEQNNGGRSVARNNGARAARSQLLIFVDDDMIVSRDLVQRHVYFHVEHFGILCGDVTEIAGLYRTDIQNYKSWLTAKWTNKYIYEVTQMTAEDLFFTAANCSISKKVFWQLNGFNEQLKDVEDFELARRALGQGVPVFYDKRLKAVHNEQITCISYIRRLREYSSARKKLNVLDPASSNSRRKLTKLKRMIYRMFAFPFWVWLIDTGFLRHVLPERIRYAFYSLIIQALAYEYDKVRI